MLFYIFSICKKTEANKKLWKTLTASLTCFLGKFTNKNYCVKLYCISVIFKIQANMTNGCELSNTLMFTYHFSTFLFFILILNILCYATSVLGRPTHPYRRLSSVLSLPIFLATSKMDDALLVSTDLYLNFGQNFKQSKRSDEKLCQ